MVRRSGLRPTRKSGRSIFVVRGFLFAFCTGRLLSVGVAARRCDGQTASLSHRIRSLQTFPGDPCHVMAIHAVWGIREQFQVTGRTSAVTGRLALVGRDAGKEVCVVVVVVNGVINDGAR